MSFARVRNYTNPEIRERNGCFYVHLQFRNRTTGCFEDFRINSTRAKHDLAYANELCRRTRRAFRMGYRLEDKDFVKHKVEERIFLYIGKLNWFEWLLETCDSWGGRIGMTGNFLFFVHGIIFQFVPLYAIASNQPVCINKNVLIFIILCVCVLGLPAELIVQRILCKRYQHVAVRIPSRILLKLNLIVLSILFESYIVGGWLQYIAYKSGLIILIE